VDPLKLPDLEFESDLLANNCTWMRPKLYTRIKATFDSHRAALWVKRGITPQEADDSAGA
jgi:hypothetical protein